MAPARRVQAAELARVSDALEAIGALPVGTVVDAGPVSGPRQVGVPRTVIS